jgi:hypothetical protein
MTILIMMSMLAALKAMVMRESRTAYLSAKRTSLAPAGELERRGGKRDPRRFVMF